MYQRSRQATDYHQSPMSSRNRLELLVTCTPTAQAPRHTPINSHLSHHQASRHRNTNTHCKLHVHASTSLPRKLCRHFLVDARTFCLALFTTVAINPQHRHRRCQARAPLRDILPVPICTAAAVAGDVDEKNTSVTWEPLRLDGNKHALDHLAKPVIPQKRSKGRRTNSSHSAQGLGTYSIRDTWLRLITAVFV